VRDTTPPTVSVTVPTEGATVSGNVILTANATDDALMSRVEFFVDGQSVGTSGTSSTSPYGYSWNSRSVSNGAHTLTAKAHDAAGNTALSAPRAFTVDNDLTPPVTGLTSPAPGAALAGWVSLQASASDDRGMGRVEFLVDGTRVASVTAPPYVATWDSHAVGNGSHTLTVKAYDAAGNATTSAAVAVSVAQPGSAVYDATRKVPVCAQVSGVCDSEALLQGRGAVLGPELHQPNTLDGCADGNTSRVEQVRWIRVSRVSGAFLAQGQRARIEVGVEVDSTPSLDSLDLYYTGNAAAPAWTHVTTLQASAGGLQVLSAEYTLPAGSLQAVRARFRRGGSSISACTVGTADDHDDLAFAAGVQDVTPPTVALTAPASNDALGGTVTVTATAADDFGVTRVEFYDGQTLLGTDTSAPYSVSWDTVGVAEGAHTLTARAYDGEGLTGTSVEVPVVIDNTAPSASLTAPTGTHVRGTVQLAATASDNRAVVRVEFHAGAELLGTATTAPYTASWDTTGWPEGAHTLSVRAYDAAGNVHVTTRTVTLDNVSPTVALTSPQNGGTVFLSVTLQASASDTSGVTQVVFYDGGTVIGTDTTAPYSVSWNTLLVAKGKHTLTARATDRAGNVTTSAPISVTVQ
jgi:hypothetical protein